MSDDSRLRNQVILNIGEVNKSALQIEQNSSLRRQLRDAEAAQSRARTMANNESSDLYNQIADLRRQVAEQQGLTFKNNKLQQEVSSYKELLTKPMHEIAHVNEDFKNTYEAQQEVLADWIVSQKAFKELAISFGVQAGRTQEDVVKLGINGELDVLNNKNLVEHKTNASDSELVTFYAEVLKQKLKK